MDYKTFFKIINGDFDKIPKDKPKQVRIFLSSTFSDTHTERDYLIATIYPKLKNYCKKTYNLDFQILDMRWGISSDVTNTHMATQICLNEIKICQSHSIGPNFITLLSHRYGNRALPTRIIKEELDMLKAELNKRADVDKSFKYEFVPRLEENVKIMVTFADLMEDCYELDDNEIPARYRLKYLDRLFEPGVNQRDPAFNKMWSAIEHKLGSLLRNAATICFHNEFISKTEYERYFVSITEKEIFNGILRASKENNVADNVLYFEREIEDIGSYVDTNPGLAGKFIDLDEDKKIDQSAKVLLDTLKHQKIGSKLPGSNTFKFKVKFDKDVGISLATHTDYITKFGETFYEQVVKLIDKNHAKNEKIQKLHQEDSELLREVLDHARFCKEKVALFHGRTDLVDRMKEYVLDSDNKGPFVIHGESGCGKTAILAKLADEIPKFVPDPQNYTVILRFLGTTPSTTIVIKTLTSIITQLARIYNLEAPLNKNKVKVVTRPALKEIFYDMLNHIAKHNPKRKIVIILDSIDQLAPSDYDLDWVLDELPNHVKMLYSVIGTHRSILKNFKEIIKLPPGNLCSIEALSIDLAKEIISDWLKMNKRSISKKQWEVIDVVFKKAQLFPLYVKLIYDIISKWTAFHEPKSDFYDYCLNIDGCIKYLFALFERDHGHLLFSRSVIYMSSFANGISESEIEDILSLDDDVLYSIFEFHAPPVRKLPVALWARIKNDLSGYMVQKEIEDSRVIYWYHRRFIEVAQEHYVSLLDKEVFMNVIDFFNETWKHKPKPYKFNEYVSKKNKVKDNDQLAAVRDTSFQPTIFTDSNGKLRFNTRKIQEFPEFITKLKKGAGSTLAAENIYYNYQFLTGMMAFTDTDTIMERTRPFTEESSYRNSNEAEKSICEISIACSIFLQCMISLKDSWKSCVGQFLARSLIFYAHNKHLTMLTDQYDKESLDLCALIVPYQFLPEPGSEVLFTYDKHVKPITCTAIGGDRDGMVFTLSDKLYLFNITSIGTKSNPIEMEKINEVFKFLIVYSPEDLETGISTFSELIGGFIVASDHYVYSYSFQNSIYMKNHYAGDEAEFITNICLISANHFLVAFRERTYIDIFNLYTGELVERKQFDKKIKFVVTNSFKNEVNFTSYYDPIDYLSLIAVVLEEGELVVFNLKRMSKEESDESDVLTLNMSFKTTTFNGISLEEIYKLPPSGFECVSALIIPRGNVKIGYKSFKADELCLTFCDGSVLMVPFFLVTEHINLDNQINRLKLSNNPVFIKPQIDELQSISFQFKNKKINKFLTDYPFLLFIGSNGWIYIQYKTLASAEKSFSGIVEIPGHFDNVTLMEWDASLYGGLVIAAFSGGMITYYVIQIYYESNEYKYYKASENIIHYENITFFFVKDHHIMTSSLDSSLKVSHVDLELNKVKISFDRTLTNIEDMALINDDHVITKAYNELSVWKLSNGKIVDSLRTNAEEFPEKFLFKTKLLTLTRNQSYHIIRGYSMDTRSKTVFTEDFSLRIPKRKHFKMFLLDTDSTLQLIMLNEYNERPTIELYNISYNELIMKSKMFIIHPTGHINLDSFANSDWTDGCRITPHAQMIVLCIESHLIFISIDSKKIVVNHDISLETSTLQYFLSPTNPASTTLLKFETIRESDDLIAINNLNKLVYIRHDKASNVIKLISLDRDDFCCKSFQIKQNYLLAHEANANQLVAYNLDSFKKENKQNCFRYTAFRIEFKDEDLFQYGMSEDCKYVYALVNIKILRLYRVKDTELIAEFPLYSKPGQILCSSEFVAVTMADRKVISFLICDPLRKDNVERINRLERKKNILDEAEKTFKENLVKKATKHATGSGCDPRAILKFFELHKKFQEENSEDLKINTDYQDEKFIDLAKNIHTNKVIPYFNKTLDSEQLKPNWLIDLLKENSLISDHRFKPSYNKLRIEDVSESPEEPKDNDELIDDFKKSLQKEKTTGLFRNSGNTSVCSDVRVRTATCNIQ